MDPIVRFVNQTITSPPSKMPMDVNHVWLVTVIQMVRFLHFQTLIKNILTPGSTDLQCSIDGKCKCKPGVTGDKCDRCEANYWNFPDEADLGCESCNCFVEGSAGNR